MSRMNQLARSNSEMFWGPWSDLFRDFDHMLEPKQRLSPAVDITENENGYALTFDLPGLKKEDIDIEVNGNSLVVAGRRQFEDHVNRENYRRIERQYGEFRREFTLPDNVKSEGIEANYENGVLQLVIAKTESAKPRKITLNEKAGGGLLRKIFPAEKQVETSGS